MEMWDKAHGYFVYLSLCKFDPSEKATSYYLERLLGLNVTSVLKKRRSFHDLMMRVGLFKVSSYSDEILTCKTNNDIEIVNHENVLAKGCFYSMSEWLEASMLNIQRSDSSFSVEDNFKFDGFTYLCNSYTLHQEVSSELDQLLILSREGKNLAVFENNHLIEIIINGKNYIDFFKKTLKVKQDIAATEFSFGCIQNQTNLDFSINSPFNKASGGVHIGLGTDDKVPYINLIAQDAQIIY